MSTTKLTSKNFIITEDLVDSQGDSLWRVTSSLGEFEEFVIHVSSNNQMYVSVFRHKYNNDFLKISYVSKALHILCKHLSEKNDSPSPSISIKATNTFLCLAARNAGMHRKKSLKKQNRIVYKFG